MMIWPRIDFDMAAATTLSLDCIIAGNKGEAANSAMAKLTYSGRPTRSAEQASVLPYM